MRAMRQALILVALAAVAAFGTQAWHPRAPALYLTQEPLRDDEVGQTGQAIVPMLVIGKSAVV